MSVATTVKLPPTLRKRIRPLARAAGKTAHAWMVEALSVQVEREERRQRFVAEAVESQLAVAEGEPVYDAAEAFAYLRQRAAGRKVKRPAAKKRSR
jgi:predicted transcriptional regulator